MSNKRKKAAQARSWEDLTLACVNLHYDLHAAGLYATGQAMARVVEAIGWERADKAARGVYGPKKP